MTNNPEVPIRPLNADDEQPESLEDMPSADADEVASMGPDEKSTPDDPEGTDEPLGG